MKKEIVTLDEIKLVGITTSVNNSKEITLSQQINAVVDCYYDKDVRSRIVGPKNAGKTFSVYANYESDFRGAYDYFIGEEVESFDNQPENLSKLAIPKQTYVQYFNGPGKVPDIIIEIWKRVWTESDQEISGNRAYICDFDIFDPTKLVRNQETGLIDYEKASVEVFVGIKQARNESLL